MCVCVCVCARVLIQCTWCHRFNFYHIFLDLGIRFSFRCQQGTNSHNWKEGKPTKKHAQNNNRKTGDTCILVQTLKLRKAVSNRVLDLHTLVLECLYIQNHHYLLTEQTLHQTQNISETQSSKHPNQINKINSVTGMLLHIIQTSRGKEKKQQLKLSHGPF